MLPIRRGSREFPLRLHGLDGESHADAAVFAVHRQTGFPVSLHIVVRTVQYRMAAGDNDRVEQTAYARNQLERPVTVFCTVAPVKQFQTDSKPVTVDHDRIVVTDVDVGVAVCVCHTENGGVGGAGEIIRIIDVLSEGQRKGRTFLKAAADTVDDEFLRVPFAVFSFVPRDGNISTVPAERDVSDVDVGLHLFPPDLIYLCFFG